MPFHVTQEDGYLRIALMGSVTIDDLFQAFREVAGRDGDHPQPRLWVFPEHVDGFTYEDFKQLAALGQSLHVGGRAACVAPSDYIYGLTRQSISMRRDEGGRFEVFRTEAEARDWLGV